MSKPAVLFALRNNITRCAGNGAQILGLRNSGFLCVAMAAQTCVGAFLTGRQ